MNNNELIAKGIQSLDDALDCFEKLNTPEGGALFHFVQSAAVYAENLIFKDEESLKEIN